ncbi:MAG TPA: Trm112 family protein [Thermoanaerobaculia bacterium]
MPIDPALLDILRCPESHAPLVQEGDRLVSTDRKTRRSYRVEDGELPVMVVEESDVLDERAWLAVMQRHGVKI